MRVLHFGASDLFGGAARSAYRLHQGLNRLGLESSMLVARRASADESVVEFVPARDIVRRGIRGVLRWRNAREVAAYDATRPAGFEPFHTERSRFAAEQSHWPLPSGVFNLHWISEFVDYAALLPRLATHGPIVWTLHDMNVVTGGCHYDHECGRYRQGCGNCPQLGSGREEDLSRAVWLRKHRVFSKIPAERLHFVTPSAWLKQVVEASPLAAGFAVSVIPYGLDTDVFAPRDKAMAREQLGLPQDARVILFVAHSSDIRRKGFDLLTAALAGLEDDVTLLTVGEGGKMEGLDLSEVRLGRVEEDERLALIYSAADVFVIPSREDNLPNTVLESLACGTPVAGFAVGGIPEMVRDGVTGCLAPRGDVRALRAGITTLLSNADRQREMSQTCRRVALAGYRLELQAERYRNLYANMLKPSTSGEESATAATRHG